MDISQSSTIPLLDADQIKSRDNPLAANLQDRHFAQPSHVVLVVHLLVAHTSHLHRRFLVTVHYDREERAVLCGEFSKPRSGEKKQGNYRRGKVVSRGACG